VPKPDCVVEHLGGGQELMHCRWDATNPLLPSPVVLKAVIDNFLPEFDEVGSLAPECAAELSKGFGVQLHCAGLRHVSERMKLFNAISSAVFSSAASVQGLRFFDFFIRSGSPSIMLGGILPK
jgi:hypothetical protein